MHVYLYQYKTQTIQALEFFLKHALNLFDERKLTASTDLQPRYLELSSPCYVLGDIHGNLTDLEFFHQRVWPNGPQVGRAPACNGLMPSSWFASVTANVLVRAASSGMISYAMMWRRGSEYACELEMAQQVGAQNASNSRRLGKAQGCFWFRRSCCVEEMQQPDAPTHELHQLQHTYMQKLGDAHYLTGRCNGYGAGNGWRLPVPW
jgi:hypothetical protein